MPEVKSLLFLLICLSQFVSASAECDEKDSLFHKVWFLKKIQGVDIPKGSSLVFEPLKVTGSTGCNKFWAPIEYKGNSEIDIGPPQSPRFYCFRAMAMERAYLAALESIKSFNLNGTSLKMIMDGGDVFLEFEISSKEE